MKYLKNTLFIVFLAALFLSHDIFKKSEVDSRIVYGVLFACMMIIASFRRGLIPFASILIVSAAATVFYPAFPFMFLPVFISIFIAVKSFDGAPKSEMTVFSALCSGSMLTCLACVLYRDYWFVSDSLYSKDDFACRLPLIIIMIAGFVLTAVCSAAVGKSVKSNGNSFAKRFFLPFSEAGTDKNIYDKKRGKVLPVNLITVTNALIFALDIFYLCKTNFYGPKIKLFFAGWAVMSAALVCAVNGFDFPGKIKAFIKSKTE